MSELISEKIRLNNDDMLLVLFLRRVARRKRGARRINDRCVNAVVIGINRNNLLLLNIQSIFWATNY